MKKIPVSLGTVILLLLLLLLPGCHSDWPEMGANGNTDLSQVDFYNMSLVPPLQPGVTNYYLVQTTNTLPLQAIILTRLYKTRLRINGSDPIVKRTYYETNNMGYPTYTPISPLTNGAVAGYTNGRFELQTIAEDGSVTNYTINLLGEKYDASIQQVLLHNLSTPYPEFDDGVAPHYSDSDAPDGYQLIASDTNFGLGVIARNSGASTYIIDVDAGTTNSVTQGTTNALTVSSDAQWHKYQVMVISEVANSELGFTNIKTFKVKFIPKEDNNQLANIEITSGTEKLKPGYYFDQTNYTIIFEEKATVDFRITPNFTNQVISIDRDGDNTFETVLSNQTSYDITAVPVTMGNNFQVKVSSINGTYERVYGIKFMSFTTTPYDFDGGIKQYIETVKIKAETTGAFTVTGIITVADYFGYNDAPHCFFLEDKNYGLYVFLQISNDPDRVESPFKVGHKVTIDIPEKGSKIYYGMPEAVAYENMRFADPNNPNDATDPVGQVQHSIHVLPKPDFYNPTSLARMHKFSGRVHTEMNARQVGFFEPLDGGPLVQFHINDPVYYNEMLPWLTQGTTGTYYGPVLWSWGKYQFELVNNDYTIVDGR